MRRTFLLTAAGVALASMMGLTAARGTDLKSTDPGTQKAPAVVPNPFETEKCTDKCHGTSVEFVESPSEAGKLAKKAEKLVFILHVSGNFENPNFT